MIEIIRRCQNSRLVEGFHSLFHESVVAPLFVGVLWVFVGVFGCLWVLEVSLFVTIGSNMPLGPLGKEKKKNLLPHQNDREAVTFVNLTFWI